jgi:hypothetical protein
MIRLTWLQFRAQAVTAAAVLAAFAVLLAATGPHLASIYAADGLSSCHGSSCANLAVYFTASLARGPYGVLFLLSTGVIYANGGQAIWANGLAVGAGEWQSPAHVENRS